LRGLQAQQIQQQMTYTPQEMAQKAAESQARIGNEAAQQTYYGAHGAYMQSQADKDEVDSHIKAAENQIAVQKARQESILTDGDSARAQLSHATAANYPMIRANILGLDTKGQPLPDEQKHYPALSATLTPDMLPEKYIAGIENIIPAHAKSVYDADGENIKQQQTNLNALKNNAKSSGGGAGTSAPKDIQKEWDTIVKEANPLTASNRNPLGAAAKATYNANRAIQTLTNPVVTNQEAGNVMADIASIYQGGSPTEMGMKEQQYNSLKSKVAGMMQMITGNPQDALPAPIKQRLLGVLADMKNTNSSVVKQQLDYLEGAQSQVIKYFPDQWKKLRGTIESDAYSGVTGNGGAPSSAVPDNAPVLTTKADVMKLPSGSKFMYGGTLHIKK